MKMFFNPNSCPFQGTVSRIFLLGLILSLPRVSEAQTQIFKANNTTNLDLGASWVGGVVPTGANIIGYNNTNSASSTASIGAGINVAGILFSTNPASNISINVGTGPLGLGASGINLTNSTLRTLAINTPIRLDADQTWCTGPIGNISTPATQITTTNIISGTSKLTIDGPAGAPYSPVFLNNASNTYSGGTVLNSGGALRLNGVAAFSGGAPTASAIGTGNLTINGGLILGNGATVGPVGITVNGDFNVNATANTTLNGRLTIGGGTINLGNATRNIYLGKLTNSLAATNGPLVGGNEGLKLAYSAGAPNLVVTNGVLRFVLGAGAAPANYTSVNFASGVAFANGAGMIVGSNVFVTFAGSGVFAGGMPSVALEEGGYWNLGALSGPQNASPIRSLAGLGTVTCIATNTNANTPALSVSNSVGELSEFAGSVTDGFNLNSVLGTTSLNTVLVSIAKSGAGTQILSGSNNYSGFTTVSAGELRFSKRKSLYAANTSLWNKISVTNGAILGLNLAGSDPFTASDFQTLASDANNSMKTGAYFGVAVSSSDYPSGLSANLFYTNAANPGGIGLVKSGNGNLTLTGLPSSSSVPLQVTGGRLILNGVSTFSGSPSISGGGVLDLGNATFPIPNSVTLTDGSLVNFTAGVADPFAPTSNPSYTGFSFAVNNLNGNGKTFYLTNATLTVNGNVETNAFNVTGAASGIMRLTGSTLGQGDTNASKGQINVQDSATLVFASNSVFDSYRVLAMSSVNPKLLVSGGTISNLNYVMLGAGSTNRGTLQITSGSLAVLNPNPSQNGFYFGQNGGTGNFNLEGGSASTTVLKVQSGTANINISGGTLNLVTTNAATNPATSWSLSGNGTVNFTMSGGSVSAPNSKFNLSSGNSTANILTNVSYLHTGGTISSVEMSAGAGTFIMNGGTNESSAGMFVGDNTNGSVSFAQNGGLVRIKGEAGSSAANDLVIGSANGNGTYILNGGVLEVFGKIRKNSGTSFLVLNGGTIRYTNSTSQSTFITSLVDTTVGSNGAIFEITDPSVTNSIQATLKDVSGQAGKLVKRGYGVLSIGRANLNYTGSTLVEDGKLAVTGTDFTAEIANNAVNMTFNPAPDANTPATNTYSILPGALQNGTTAIFATGLASNQSITFDPSTATAQVVTTAVVVNPPVITSSSSFSATVGVPFNSQMTASGAVPITFSGVDLPAGLSVNSDGSITGTPLVAGSFTAKLTATNSGGATDQNCTFSVAKGTPVITVLPTVATITYGQTLANSTLAGGTAGIPGSFAYTTPSTIPNAGTVDQDFTFTPADAVNYNNVSGKVSVTVNPKALTVTGLSASNKEYDGSNSVTVTGTAAYFGLANGDNFDASTNPVTWAFQDPNVGTSKSLNPTGSYAAPSGNYTVTQPVLSASIIGRSLTVTANGGQSKKAGEADPVFSYAITGGSLVNGDVLTGSLSRVSGETVGTYDITQGTLAAGSNYNLSYTKASFEIQPNGPDFATAFPGANATALGADGMPNLLRYAMGANNTSDSVVKPVSSVNASVLSITAIVRTNDPKVNVVGEVATGLASWSTTGVTMTVSPDTNGVPAGCQRQVFSVDRANSPSKQFLRLKATLQP
jgi:autotransporter-associated beta strand protein